MLNRIAFEEKDSIFYSVYDAINAEISSFRKTSAGRKYESVANAADLCPLTPQGTAVNADGCNGPQLIALTCVRENFVQHGQYVSCVAHAANDAVGQGLLSPNEKARLVREAAKK